MARAVQPRESQFVTEQHIRKPSGFQPAQRMTSIPPQRPPPRDIFREREREEEEPEDRREEIGTQPLTKSGYPDRRFKGQRDLPPPEEQNPDFQRARTGGTVGNVHVTIEGKPDRRFKENRGLSDEEVMAQWVDALQEKYGRKQRR